MSNKDNKTTTKKKEVATTKTTEVSKNATAEERSTKGTTAKKTTTRAKATKKAGTKGTEETKKTRTTRKSALKKVKEDTAEVKMNKEYAERFDKHIDELKWLYFELYSGQQYWFDQLCTCLYGFYKDRNKALRDLDRKREKDKDWYRKNELIGMMMYTDNFADNLEGVKKNIPYLKKSNINYLHLMPLLDTTEGKSDGGYAVSDYRKVQDKLGTMEDLEKLTEECHKQDMCVCLDYVMNHTSEDHEWARRARAGEREYQDRYFFYDNYDLPAQFEQTVPQVFPKTAPGNFTYLPELNKHVMTSFYPYQWDLNYWNPVVFNEMVYNMLFLANKGIDILRIDAVPYIWKQLGTTCRNLPQVHTIVRMIRMITEIVCPGVLLLGEVVMEPKELAPYFGTVDKPECHLLYNATTMCTLWHTVATKDTRLLKFQTDQVCSLPKEYGFINYIRCHDDIGWGLDFNLMKEWGEDERAHKQFLNDYFLGNYWDSMSTGELYNADPVTGDARFCATTASMCGIERGLYEGNNDKVNIGIQLDMMLHAFLLFQSGIPVIYSGDEVGQCNDWHYKEDPLKVQDSRYVHRGKFDWKLADDINVKGTVAERVHTGLKQLEDMRKSSDIFNSDADVYTVETHNSSIMGMIRIKNGKKILGLFNFSNQPQKAWVWELRDNYTNVWKDDVKRNEHIELSPYEYLWLEQA